MTLTGVVLYAMLILQPPTDTFLMNVFCAVTDTGGESNPIIATLAQDPDPIYGGYACYCQRVFAMTPNTKITCSLFFTTCPIVNITLTVM